MFNATYYPVANTSDTRDILNIFQFVSNSLTDGLFFPMVLMGFGVALFMGTQKFGTPRAFGFASVSCLLASLYLSTMKLMPWWISTIYIVVGVGGMVMLVMNER